MALSDAEVAANLQSIQQASDATTRNFQVAALVSDLFREQGVDPVVVGRSAVEFYTEGQYVSGDVDLCFAGVCLPTPTQRTAVMARVGAHALGLRKFVVAGVYVDLLGAIETGARTSFGEVGSVKLIAIEDLVAERISQRRLIRDTDPSRSPSPRLYWR